MAKAHWVPAATRSVIMGTRYMVSAGHYLAAASGVRILEKGGNAFSAPPSDGVTSGLAALGHDVTPWPDWTGTAGSLGAVIVDPANGVRHGGADPRRVAYAIGR